MKHILPLLIALLLMTGCHRPTTSELCTDLQRAEALMYPHPDSALHILQTMPIPQPSDKLQYATWALFMTQAKYKLYMNQSDSLINVAYDFFMHRKDSQRKAMVLYYKASLLKEKTQMEDAQNLYLKAIEDVEKTTDYQLAHLIYSGIGSLYLYNSLSGYAVESYIKAYDNAQKSKNKKLEGASLIYLGRAYENIGQTDRAIDLYKQASVFLSDINEYKMQASVLNDLACILNRNQEYKLALFYAKESMELRKSKSLRISEQLYLTLGEIYQNLSVQDSAYYYFNKALNSNNIHTLKNTHISLYNLCKNSNNYKDAISYLEKAWIYNDSITKLDKNRTLIEMQEKYDQQKVKDEAAMEIRLQKQRTQTTIGIIIVVVLLAGVYARHRYRRRIARLAEAEDRIDTLSRMLEEAQQATGEDDAFVKRILLQQLGVIRLVANTPTAQNQALLRRLAEIGNDQVPVEELIVWEDLYPLIDRLYNGFHSRLTERFGSILTDKEVQICCLLCADFSTKEISVITRQSPSSIYVRKTSIRKKLGAEEGADIVEVVKNLS